MESAAVSGMAKCSSSAILPCMVAPQASRPALHRRINLNMGFACCARAPAAWLPSLARFSRLCGWTSFAVSSRGSGGTRPGCRDDELATRLHAGDLAADEPVSARLGAAVARHLFHRDLPHRRSLDYRDGVF